MIKTTNEEMGKWAERIYTRLDWSEGQSATEDLARHREITSMDGRRVHAFMENHVGTENEYSYELRAM